MSDLEIKLDCKTKNLPSFENVENEYIKCNNNQLVIKEAFFKAKKVDNVFRYCLKNKKLEFLKKDEENFKFSKFDDNLIDENDDTSNIIIVLESPHKDEYTFDFKPIAPAQGSTGKNIEKYIEKYILSILDNNKLELNKKKYKILIVNPVPYQTSLNFIHKKALKNEYKKLRNEVWKALWENANLKTEFESLINNLKPKLILNCCTKDLKCYVSDAINEKFNINENVYKIEELSHPCYWTRDERLKKILKPCKNSKNS